MKDGNRGSVMKKIKDSELTMAPLKPCLLKMVSHLKNPQKSFHPHFGEECLQAFKVTFELLNIS